MALNQQQIDMIRMYIDIGIKSGGIAKPKKIYNELKLLIDLDADKFITAVSYLISSSIIDGFELGSDGYIYPEGHFKKLEEAKSFSLAKRIPPTFTTIIDGKEYKLMFLSKDDFYSLLVTVLHAKESDNGNVCLDGKSYIVDGLVLKRFVETFYAAA